MPKAAVVLVVDVPDAPSAVNPLEEMVTAMRDFYVGDRTDVRLYAAIMEKADEVEDLFEDVRPKGVDDD